VVCASQSREGYSALRHLLVALLLNHDPARTWVWIMSDFIAYLDDGGHPIDQDVVLVAGWLSTEQQWLLFEPEWKKALTDHGIPLEIGFHMTDFECADYKLYQDWSPDRKERFLFRLINLLRSRTRMFFSVLVPMYDYRKVNEKITVEECVGKPYAVAGRIVGAQLRHWAARYNKANDPVVMVFEDGSLHKGDLMDVLKRDNFDPPVFRDRKKVVPLQGADLLAWEYFNAFKTGELRPSLEYILGHPGIDGKYGEKELLETCQIAKAPPREALIGHDIRFHFHNLKKKERKRTLYESPSEASIKGSDRTVESVLKRMDPQP
jgi:hypothetical protein